MGEIVNYIREKIYLGDGVIVLTDKTLGEVYSYIKEKTGMDKEDIWPFILSIVDTIVADRIGGYVLAQGGDGE